MASLYPYESGPGPNHPFFEEGPGGEMASASTLTDFGVCNLRLLQCLDGTRVFNYAVVVLPDEQPSPEQITALRSMPGEKRLLLAERLYWSARRMKAAGLRSQHPDWPEDRVNAEVTRIFLHART